MEQRGQELNSFEEIVKKTVNAKAKATFKPRSYACNTNQHCFQGSRPSAAKISTQGQLMKNPRVEELKPKSLKRKISAPQCSNSAETSEKAQKEKKKKEKREGRNRKRKPQDTTPATEVNTINTSGGYFSGSGGRGERSQKDPI